MPTDIASMATVGANLQQNDKSLIDALPFWGLTLLIAALFRNRAKTALDPCPVYRLAYGESGTVVEINNELNCPAAPDEIPAGGGLLFAAELELPSEEVPRGFVGSVMVDIYLDDAHQTAAAAAELTTE